MPSPAAIKLDPAVSWGNEKHAAALASRVNREKVYFCYYVWYWEHSGYHFRSIRTPVWVRRTLRGRGEGGEASGSSRKFEMINITQYYMLLTSNLTTFAIKLKINVLVVWWHRARSCSVTWNEATVCCCVLERLTEFCSALRCNSVAWFIRALWRSVGLWCDVLKWDAECSRVL